VLLALEGKFFIVELEYMAGLLLPVDGVYDLSSTNKWPSRNIEQATQRNPYEDGD
jgi:hypothetical protein